MSDLGGPAVAELLAWAQAADRSLAAKRARVLRLIEPWWPWLSRLPIIKVAGTNGKGSVCAMLSAVLRRDGRRPALFTSPHLVRVTERFRVDDREVEPATLEFHAVRVLQRARELVRRHGEAFRPTFFEALLATAVDLFREAGADVLVCEAGVGGTHDATSLLPGELGALTSVGLDHQDVLGDTLEAIAIDKAGIVGPGGHLVLGPGVAPRLRTLVAAHAPEVTLSQAVTDGFEASLHGERPTRIAVALDDGPLSFTLPLIGAHQIGNFAVVLELSRRLRARGVLHDLRSLAGLEAVRWPGRLELRAGPPRVLLDAAHNVEGLETLARALDGLVPRAARVLAFGLSLGKDAAGCASRAAALAPAAYLVEGFHRARPAVELRALLPAGVACRGAFDTPRALVEHVTRDAGQALGGATLVVAGSIFMVGDFERALAAARAPAVPDDVRR